MLQLFKHFRSCGRNFQDAKSNFNLNQWISNQWNKTRPDPLLKQFRSFWKNGAHNDNTHLRGWDIHGRLSKIQSLWENIVVVTNRMREVCNYELNVVFLGDYCDRGEHTCATIDFLLGLHSAHTDMTFKFLSGNHDHAFLKFLESGENYSDTCQKFIPKKPELLYCGRGIDDMHLQGRRWAGEFNGRSDSIYQSQATFQSYDCSYADRDTLIRNMPSSHKEFLRSMPLVLDTQYDLYGRIVAVHAGLEEGSNEEVEAQIQKLKEGRDNEAWIEPICGRRNVMELPEPLMLQQAWLISGHHTMFSVRGRRLIIDECGGRDQNRLSAVMFLPAAEMLAEVCESSVDHDSVSWCDSVDPLVKLLRIRSSH